MFQSTRPRGARLELQIPLRAGFMFQSTRPRGARRRHGYKVERLNPFQSTRPRGARPRAARPLAHHYGRFNPRARAGRDLSDAQQAPTDCVSIHAPARGATSRSLFASCQALRFNPRARAGRDCGSTSGQHRNAVSIHAPARGATC